MSNFFESIQFNFKSFSKAAEVLSHGVECTTNAVDSAARSGHTRIVELLLLNGKKFTTAAHEDAFNSGHLEIVNLLVKHSVISGNQFN